MPAPRLERGWVTVPYRGRDLATVHLATVDHRPADGDWRPGFLDHDDTGARVAKVRIPAGAPRTVQVWLRVDGAVSHIGPITLP